VIVDDGGVFIVKGQGVACDPNEAIIDDLTWGGPCWALHLVLSYDCVSNDDHLEMAVGSSDY